MIVVANKIFSRLIPFRYAVTLGLHRVLEPRAVRADPELMLVDGLADQVVFYTCNTWIEWRQKSIYCKSRDVGARRLEIYKRLSSACTPGLSFSTLQTCCLTTLPMFPISYLPPLLDPTLVFLPCGHRPLPGWASAKNLCDVPHASRLESLRVLNSASHRLGSVVCVERLVMLTTLWFPRSHQIPRS